MMIENNELENKVMNNPLYIREIENPSEELILKAIRKKSISYKIYKE